MPRLECQIKARREAAGRGTQPDDASIRRALVRWGFNTRQRSDPPEDVAEVLAWVARNSGPVSVLVEAATRGGQRDPATSGSARR